VVGVLSPGILVLAVLASIAQGEQITGATILISHTEPAAKEATGYGEMSEDFKGPLRQVLRIPDLEQSKHAVLNSLPAKTSQESHGHAINEFISWYCSEPRLAFDRNVVLRYRFFLERKNLAPSGSWHGCVDPMFMDVLNIEQRLHRVFEARVGGERSHHAQETFELDRSINPGSGKGKHGS
jgi:hypothetical protein